MHRPRFLIAVLALMILSGSTLSAQAQGEDSADQQVEIVRENAKADSGRHVHMDHGVPISKNPTGALFRSILVPGWGQLYTGHPIKAIAFFGTDLGMLYGIWYQNRQYEDYLDQSKNTKSDLYRIRLEDLADFYRNDRNKLIWWTAGVVMLSGFDAYVEAHLYDFRIEPMLGTTPSGTGVSTGLRITF